MKRTKVIAVYGLLTFGAAIFAWPFIWMASTSAKLERELFGEHPARPPEAPNAVLASPYVDQRMFHDVTGPRMQEVLPLIEQELQTGNYLLPNDVVRSELIRQVARGIYQQLVASLAPDIW